MLIDFSESKGVNFSRYAVKNGEYLVVAEGFAMVTHGAIFIVDGYLRLDGLLVVGSCNV